MVYFQVEDDIVHHFFGKGSIVGQLGGEAA